MTEPDLLEEEPNAYPAYFQRPGYCLSYEISGIHATIRIHRFAGACLPEPDVANIRLETPHMLLRVRIQAEEKPFFLPDEIPNEGTVLSYHYYVVENALRNLLDIVCVEDEDHTRIIQDFSACNHAYLCRLN